MPLYSYHCAGCDKEFELLVSSSDTPDCPTCGGKNLAWCLEPHRKARAAALPNQRARKRHAQGI
jgi:putative FmdB family regulatory protein